MHTPAVFGMSVQQVGRSNKFAIIDVRDRFYPIVIGTAYGRYYATVLRNILAGFSEATSAQLARTEMQLSA